MTKKRNPITPDGKPAATSEDFCPGTRIAFNRRDRFAREGHSRLFLDHDGNPVGGMAKSWGDCWKCHRPLGCTMCTTTNELEILCKPCAAWCTFEAFEHHGPIVANPRVPRPAVFAEYPEAWRARYTPVSEEFPWYKGGFDFESVNKLLGSWNVLAKGFPKR